MFLPENNFLGHNTFQMDCFDYFEKQCVKGVNSVMHCLSLVMMVVPGGDHDYSSALVGSRHNPYIQICVNGLEC